MQTLKADDVERLENTSAASSLALYAIYCPPPGPICIATVTPTTVCTVTLE